MSDVWAETSLTRRRVVADLAVAGGFAVVFVPLHAAQSLTAGAAVVLLAFALALRRIWLPGMVALAVVSGVVQMVSTDVATVADLVYAVLFFPLGAHRDRRVRAFGLAAMVVATAGAGVWGGFVGFMAGGRPAFSVSSAIGLAALTAVVVAGGWVAGYLRLQSRRAVQARVDAQLDAAERRRLAEAFDQEQERNRIAADMHDVVAHSWAVVAAQADGARYAMPDRPAEAERALEVIGETARSAISDLRTILAQLRDRTDLGSTHGTEQQAQLLHRMRASGMTIDMAERGRFSDSGFVVMTAYRLLSESLTNALKHGDLSEPVVVRQDWTEGYHLTVTNTPHGSPDDHDGTGHGLVGMAERARLAGGDLVAHRDGDLWVVEATIPRTPAKGAS